MYKYISFYQVLKYAHSHTKVMDMCVYFYVKNEMSADPLVH